MKALALVLAACATLVAAASLLFYFDGVSTGAPSAWRMVEGGLAAIGAVAITLGGFGRFRRT